MKFKIVNIKIAGWIGKQIKEHLYRMLKLKIENFPSESHSQRDG